ncbi:MAG: Ribonuclease HII [Candidatus Izimaplasma bacterium HR2]|nr:MAG: Ribonuclease HII [Candidatus Izimaplasma bacterium HR2]
MYSFEKELLDKGHLYIAGCDEVGRGPLAGPVVAAAVILNPDIIIEGLDDSKKLTEKKRNALDIQIKENALAYKIVYIYPKEIDKINIYQASKKAMIEAIKGLNPLPSFVLSDAMPLKELGIPFESIIKGDSKSATIAAASIIAKVERDNYMVKMSKKYPEYGFEKHKGYPTKQHVAALNKYGVLDIHRTTYKPVADVINKQFKLEI